MNFMELVKAQLTGNTVNYTSTEAIYLSTPFTENSVVRFGQRQFEKGGIIDNKSFFCHNEAFTDEINEYLDGEDPEDCTGSEMVDHLLEVFGMTAEERVEEFFDN